MKDSVVPVKAMKACEAVELKLHSFLTSTLVGVNGQLDFDVGFNFYPSRENIRR
jgi:hypothetical protein